MAGGMLPVGVKKERAAEYKGHMTFAVAMACIVAAIGGSIFGYDIGISGKHASVPLYLERHLIRELKYVRTRAYLTCTRTCTHARSCRPSSI